MPKPIIGIIRYKKDLRVTDHTPLTQACAENIPLIALYAREPHIMSGSDYSHFHQYRTQESLKNLKSSLQKLHIPLLVRYDEISDILNEIRQHYDIRFIYSYEETGNHLTYKRDLQVIDFTNTHVIAFTEYPCNGVVRRLKNRDIWHKIWKTRMLEPLLPVPQYTQSFTLDPALESHSQQSFDDFVGVKKPESRTYDRDLPGEKGARVRLSYFLSTAATYRYSLSRPELAFKYSSRLSGYITYGNLSIRQVYQSTALKLTKLSEQKKSASEEDKKNITRHMTSLKAFQSRLHRHDHFIQKLESQPEIESLNQNSAFDTIRIDHNPEIVQARYEGKTGIPMIDAGMRCLQSTGRVNFRLRATLVSFICNTCMQPWQVIGPMLAKIFLDYEPGIHYSQLQMQSGTTGINTIRIYNPLKQLADKDKEFAFVHKRIPELSELTHEEILTLGTSLGDSLISSKGISYPLSIIDVIEANKKSRITLRGVKKTEESKTQAQKVYQKLGSRNFSGSSSRKKKSVIPTDTLFGDIIL